MAVQIKRAKTTDLISDDGQYYFDHAAAERVCKFMPMFLSHVKGEMGGTPYDPLPWLKERLFIPLFGWKRADNNLRQYRTFYLQVARKNDKTTSTAAIGNILQFVEDEPGAEIYTAAADKIQARNLFEICKGMIIHNPRLMSACTILKDTIIREKTGGIHQVLSSDADTKHGFNSSGVLCDELHVWPSDDLFDVLDTSTGSRREPIVGIITTPGKNKNTLCYKKYSYAKDVESGKIIDPTFLSIIIESNKEDDPFSENTWIKANPGYGITVKKDFIATRAMRAKKIPSYLNIFRQLHLGQWVESSKSWIGSDLWSKCNINKKSIEDFSGRSCFIGIETASSEDLIAIAMFFPSPSEGIPHDLLMHYWVTDKCAADRMEDKDYRYREWADQGLVDIVEGNVYDDHAVIDYIYNLCDTVKINSVGYDKLNATQIALELIARGLQTSKWVPNSWSLWNEPTKTLEKMVVQKSINHMGNPILEYQISCVVIKYMTSKKSRSVSDDEEEDPRQKEDYIKPDKSLSSDNISGVMALIIALGEWMNHKQSPEPNLTILWGT
jgi:phage terminase large subunit-like protein